MSGTILAVDHLRTQYFTTHGVVRAVDDVHFKIQEGETYGLVGESGSGKSTVGLSIARLIPSPGQIVGGRILFQNEDLMEKSEGEMREVRGGKIAMIFQDPTNSLNPVFSIGSQIEEALRLHGNMDKREARMETIKILRKVGIPSPEKMTHQYPHQCSGGMRQRVMAAIALSCNAKLLIADEPTTNLDVTTQAQILHLLREIRRSFGTTILMITHNLGVIAEMCSEVAVMYAGKIVELGDTVTIFKRPMHPYTKALLDSVPRIDLESKKLTPIPGSVPDLTSPIGGCSFHPRCKYATTRCQTEVPNLVRVEANHYFACLNYAGTWK